MYPETKQGGDRKSEEIKSRLASSDSKDSFIKNTSDKIGVTTLSEKRSKDVSTFCPHLTENVYPYIYFFLLFSYQQCSMLLNNIVTQVTK